MIVFSNFASEVYRSKGNPKLSLIAQTIHLAFVVPTIMIAVNYSFETLALARSLVRFQGILSALIIMRIVYKFRVTDVFKNVFPPVFCALIMGAFGYFVRGLLPYLWWQLITIGLCIIVYFALLLLCFPKMRRELLSTPAVTKVLNKLKGRS